MHNRFWIQRGRNRMSDNFVEFNETGVNGVRGYITEDNLTPPLPKDNIIREINNKDKEFSTDGIEERTFNCLDGRVKYLLKSQEEAKKQLEEIEERLESVKLKTKDNTIHDRFEILDIQKKQNE